MVLNSEVIEYLAQDIVKTCNKMTSAKYMHHVSHIRDCADEIIRIVKEDMSKEGL